MQPLIQFVKLKADTDKRVERFLKNVLGKTVMVKDLSTAFEISEK